MKILQDWQAYALASAFFAGAVAVLAKIGVANIPSNMATFIRTIVITFFLIILISMRGEWTNPLALDSKSLWFLIFSGLATGLSWVCYFRALQLGPASGVAALDKISLVIAVVFAILFLGEHLGWQQWGGVVLMVCGGLLIVIK